MSEISDCKQQIDRTSFFVDGFNLYHSLCEVEKKQPGQTVKWLDLPALFESHLHLISSQAKCESVRYYSAYANHLQKKDVSKITRNKAYVRALTAMRVVFIENSFKKRNVYLADQNCWASTYEEKETDVSIAVDLLELASLNQFDTAVVVSGDTDLRPACLAFQRMFPGKKLLFAFPFARKNRELANLEAKSFTFSATSYVQHQFPDKVRLPSGKFVHKPDAWK